MLHDLGRARRVQAKPLTRITSRSWTRRARPKAGSYEEDRGGAGREAAPTRRRSAHDRRAISGPLTRATRGQPRSLGTARNARSAPLAAVTAALPKLIVRVRFSSPAPRVQAQLRAGMPSPRLEHPHTFFDLAGHERATSPRGRARPPGRRHRPRRRTARLGRGSRWRS